MMNFFTGLNQLIFNSFVKRGQIFAMSGDLFCWPEISFPAYNQTILTTASLQ